MAAKVNQSKISEIVAKSFYNYIKTSLIDNALYAGVSFIDSDNWVAYTGTDSNDSETTFYGGTNATAADDADITFYNQTLVSLHKVLAGGLSRVAKRVDWTYGEKYNIDDYVIVQQFEAGYPRIHVYKCLFSPGVTSTYNPSGSSSQALFMSDDYVWKYIYTIQNVDAIRFLNEDWMPVVEPIPSQELINVTTSSRNYSQYATQISAVPGEAYGVKIDSDVLKTYYAQHSDFRSLFDSEGFTTLYGVDNSTSTPSTTMTIKLTKVDSDHFTPALTQVGKGYSGAITFVYDQDSDTTVSGITGVKAPSTGHCSNPPAELGATNVMVTVRAVPDDSNLFTFDSTKYNLITLHDSPLDASTNSIATGEFYMGCNYFTISGNNLLTTGSVFTSVADSTKEGHVVGVDGNNVYYVITTPSSETVSFVTGEQINLNGSVMSISQAYNRAITFNSSQLLIADYKQETATRLEGQIETFNFVLTF